MFTYRKRGPIYPEKCDLNSPRIDPTRFNQDMILDSKGDKQRYKQRFLVAFRHCGAVFFSCLFRKCERTSSLFGTFQLGVDLLFCTFHSTFLHILQIHFDEILPFLNDVFFFLLRCFLHIKHMKWSEFDRVAQNLSFLSRYLPKTFACES